VGKRGPDGLRWVELAPERFVGWVESFARRHGETSVQPGPAIVVFRAADGAVAQCHVPFPPLRADAGPAGQAAVVAGHAELVAAHAAADRTVGVLLVRLGGYAAGVFTGGPPRLAASKVGSRLVHGRSAAGGQSQQRFARRREKQAANALAAAADTAVAVLGPHLRVLDAVVLGGDRRAVAGLRGDPRLAPYFDRAVERFLTVPDPRLAVLRETPKMFRSVRILITDDGSAGQ
jgi:Actinobacteria/chloroflexi VLRF1 release factor